MIILFKDYLRNYPQLKIFLKLIIRAPGFAQVRLKWGLGSGGSLKEQETIYNARILHPLPQKKNHCVQLSVIYIQHVKYINWEDQKGNCRLLSRR